MTWVPDTRHRARSLRPKRRVARPKMVPYVVIAPLQPKLRRRPNNLPTLRRLTRIQRLTPIFGSINREFSAVLYDANTSIWSSVAVGFTSATSRYGTLIVDALKPAAGKSVSLGPVVAESVVSVGSFTTAITASANSVLMVVVNGETLSGSWDVSSMMASGLTFTKRSDITVSSIFSGTGIQRSQTWWAPITSDYSGSLAIALTAFINKGTVHIFGVNGADLSSPFDGTASTVAGSATDGTLTTTFSTTHSGCFVFAAGSNPNGNIIWETFEP